jgi:hypothetical protein
MDNGASMHIELTKKRRSRARDFVLYIAISFAFVAVLLAGALSHVDQGKFMKWVFISFDTLFVFGFVIEKSRPLWRRNSFWLLTGSLLLLHCIAMAELLIRVKQPKGDWLVGAVLGEIVFLLNFTRWILRSTPTPP